MGTHTHLPHLSTLRWGLYLSGQYILPYSRFYQPDMVGFKRANVYDYVI